ncbi:phosphatidylserine decarboxylase family protein [Fulvivirgaceae bacterium BMA10]|uniref:Phosphatidylserine decarboxylase proenzyme n=1 Tax=Splendidivirga corallicola TaxID=3051826 RepID=A0ABT8KUJ8_9BACT|nr:phosphatidylserine decarboxylase family protein [Fulvivirgaceae bacterium BMA10]
MTIHKEGRNSIALVIIVNAILIALSFTIFKENDTVGAILVGIGAILLIMILQFFRNPKVNPRVNENYVLAPADGKVVVIEDTEEQEYFQDKRKQISIFMSPVNVHVNRSPISGSVKYFKYHPGKYLVAWHPKSSTDNERTTVVAEMQNGLEILWRQIAGAMARRIKCYVDEGDRLIQGNEFGFIKFGSRVDVFLPLDADVKVNIGDKTKAGITVIAELQ